VDDPEVFEVLIEGDETENPLLAKYCVMEVLGRFGLIGKYGARVTTSSDIPISRGLKSSSAAANAIILATFSALGKEYTDMEVVDMGVEAAVKAKVTITGAYDDACATYFGGVVVTDNVNRKILKQYPIDADYAVVIHVPEAKIRKEDVDISKLEGIEAGMAEAHDLVLNGDFISGIRINGLAYGLSMGLDVNIALIALDAGAVTAGISGTGPATVVLVEPEKLEAVVLAIDTGAKLSITTLNREKAGLL
jgi:shikimate kinase